MMWKNDSQTLDALAEQFRGEVPEEDRPEPHHILYKKGWRPKLNSIQKEAIASKAIYKLYYGERGSGKTYGGVHEVVDYCYRNDNSLAYVIVKETGMGTEGGGWDKLLLEVLPEWVNGLGLKTTKTQYDMQTKKPYIWMSNRHGGWSKIMLASLPVSAQVEGKIRGREPDIILVDEAQNLEGDTYFTSLLMQLGRKKKRSGDPSKIIFCCNPKAHPIGSTSASSRCRSTRRPGPGTSATPISTSQSRITSPICPRVLRELRPAGRKERPDRQGQARGRRMGGPTGRGLSLRRRVLRDGSCGRRCSQEPRASAGGPAPDDGRIRPGWSP